MEEADMKRFVMAAIVMLFLFCTINSSLADTFWRTYEVVAISDNSLTLIDSDGIQIEVNKDPKDSKDYKVGYKVRYDNVRDVLNNDRWQDYTVRKVSNSSITLKHKNGDTITLGSGDVKTQLGKFKKGDKVSYDSVEKHIKLTE
jgi:cell division septal protein FtsQ